MKQYIFFLIISIILIFSSQGICENKDLVSIDLSTMTHKVVWGDTLAKISFLYYKDYSLYPYIAQINKIDNPNKIICGTTLVIPPQPSNILTNIDNTSLKPYLDSSEIINHKEEKSIYIDTNSIVESNNIDNKKDFEWIKEINNAFSIGESLKFNIKWQFIVVGYAIMEIDRIERIDGRDAYHIISKASSAPFFDKFFKVRDINESWIDVESLSSLKFMSSISEGNYKKKETIIIDQINKTFYIAESDKRGEILPWIKDVLSSLYYLRIKDLEVGKEYFIDVLSGDKVWPLKVCVLREEKIEVPAGRFECFVVEPFIRENSGIFNVKGKLNVWLTKDERKIPVLMRSKIPIGYIEAQLSDMILPQGSIYEN